MTGRQALAQRVAVSPVFSSQAGLASFVLSSASPLPDDVAAVIVSSGAADRSGVLAATLPADPTSTPGTFGSAS